MPLFWDVYGPWLVKRFGYWCDFQPFYESCESAAFWQFDGPYAEARFLVHRFGMGIEIGDRMLVDGFLAWSRVERETSLSANYATHLRQREDGTPRRVVAARQVDMTEAFPRSVVTVCRDTMGLPQYVLSTTVDAKRTHFRYRFLAIRARAAELDAVIAAGGDWDEEIERWKSAFE